MQDEYHRSSNSKQPNKEHIELSDLHYRTNSLVYTVFFGALFQLISKQFGECKFDVESGIQIKAVN